MDTTMSHSASNSTSTPLLPSRFGGRNPDTRFINNFRRRQWDRSNRMFESDVSGQNQHNVINNNSDYSMFKNNEIEYSSTGHIRFTGINPMLRRNAITESTLDNYTLNTINVLREEYSENSCSSIKIDSVYTMLNPSDNICNVCLNELQKDVKIYIFGCYHFLCESCFDNVNNTTQTCPFCRIQISNNEFVSTKGETGKGPESLYEMEALEIIKNDTNKLKHGTSDEYLNQAD